MDKASASGAGDSRFESWADQWLPSGQVMSSMHGAVCLNAQHAYRLCIMVVANAWGADGAQGMCGGPGGMRVLMHGRKDCTREV